MCLFYACASVGLAFLTCENANRCSISMPFGATCNRIWISYADSISCVGGLVSSTIIMWYTFIDEK